MAGYVINGILYSGGYLMHGLGKGSGRGRPKGSRNGYISPGAAYMKDYNVVGKKAMQDPRTSTQRSLNEMRNNRSGHMLSGSPAAGMSRMDVRRQAHDMGRKNAALKRNYSFDMPQGGVKPYTLPDEYFEPDTETGTYVTGAANEDRRSTEEANQRKWDGQNFFQKLISDPGRALSEAWNSGVSWLKGAGKTITDLGKRAWDTISSGASAISDLVLGKYTTGSNGQQVRTGGVLGVGGNMDQLGRSINNGLNAAGEWVNQAGQDVGNWANQNIVDPVLGKYTTGSNGQQVRTGGVFGVGGNMDQLGRSINNTAGAVGNWANQNIVDPVLGKYTTDPNGQQVRTGGVFGVGGNMDQLGRSINNTAGAVTESYNNAVGAMNSAGATMAKRSFADIANYVNGGGSISSYGGAVNDPDTGEPAELYTLDNGRSILGYRANDGSIAGYRYIDENDLRALGAR